MSTIRSSTGDSLLGYCSVGTILTDRQETGSSSTNGSGKKAQAAANEFEILSKERYRVRTCLGGI